MSQNLAMRSVQDYYLSNVPDDCGTCRGRSAFERFRRCLSPAPTMLSNDGIMLLNDGILLHCMSLFMARGGGSIGNPMSGAGGRS